MFTMIGPYFFNLAIYEGVALGNPTPLRTVHVPATLQPVFDIVSLDEIVEMTVLWPSSAKEDEQGGVRWDFTEV